MPKKLILLGLLALTSSALVFAQNTEGASKADQAIYALIADYTQARENQDSLLLRKILTADVDQLVSTGEWRAGIEEAMAGMARSTNGNPGTRTLAVERLRYLTDESAIADARYVLNNDDGTRREMWSTFMVVKQKGEWKISAIRNMLPAK